jgi:MFS family permease
MFKGPAEAERGTATGTLLLVTLVLFTDMMGYDLLVPVLPSYARAWQMPDTQLGVLFGCYALAQLVSVPFSAWLCERVGAMRALRLGTLAMFLTQLLYATSTDSSMLFTARLLQGVAGGTTWVAGLALLATRYPAGKRGWALGFAMGGMSLGALAGLPLGGLLFEWGGPRCPFVAAAGWTLVLALAALAVPLGKVHSQQRWESPFVLAGWKDYLRPIAAVIFGATLLSGLEPTLPVYLAERFRASPGQTGGVFGLAALLHGISAPLAGWASDRWGGRRVLLGGLAACVLILPWLAVPRSWAGEAVVLSLLGVAIAFLLSPTLPELAAISERRQPPVFGAAYAVFNMAQSLGMVVGPVTAGLLKRTWGFSAMLLAMSAASVLVLPVLLSRPRTALTST